MQCKHEIEEASCGYCNGKVKAAQDAERADSAAAKKRHMGERGWFAANWQSRCSRCDGPIAIGDRIHYVDDRVACCD